LNIVQITPGAGGMYCGNCLRDNALVGALRQMGHRTLMVPLYLPMRLEQADNSAGTPLFFGGVNVYLEQKSALFRATPRWLHRLFDAPGLLAWASGRAARTRARDLGPLTLSMLRGELGHQARELEELVNWLKTSVEADVICLSNALLAGLARRIKAELGLPVVCFLQGEDSFLNALPDYHRETAWRTLAERAAEIDLFIAPSHYFGDLMRDRLKLPAERVRVVYNGIKLDGYGDAEGRPPKPNAEGRQVLGYFARMCPEKGLDTLVEAFLILKKQAQHKKLVLRVGGGLGPADKKFVKSLRRKLEQAGLAGQYEFCPNLTLAAKQDFYRSLSVLSVPALYGEAFGLYIIEALASAVPVVQPEVAAFPELIKETGGGLLCKPGDPQALADALAQLLQSPDYSRGLGATGRRGVLRDFSIETMARNVARLCQDVASKRPAPAKPDVRATPTLPG
jgi:glycosyltransferase involved in cell wall biosynthesis